MAITGSRAIAGSNTGAIRPLGEKWHRFTPPVPREDAAIGHRGPVLAPATLSRSAALNAQLGIDLDDPD